MSFRSALFLACGLCAPAVASAQPVIGPYVSLGAGLDYLLDQNLMDGTAGYAGHPHLSNNVGALGSLAVGYGLGGGLRIELQGDFGATREDAGISTTSNYQQQYRGFLNGIYDFSGAALGLPAAVNPYVGIGAGYGVSHFSNLNFAGTDALGNGTFLRTTGYFGTYAVQAIAGLSFDIASVPGLALTAEYRFTTTPGTSSYNAQYFSTGGESHVKFKTDGQYDNAALIGFRYALFAPPAPHALPAVPPPPPPAAVPAPPEVARTYLVFFDWDRADLTTRARQIVAEAAAASTKVQTTRIEVNGYTDLSGTAAYNQRLSVRRAESVEAELVRDGVAKNEIFIQGFGETNPLIPTAKGVREPQNRRVEIILK